VKHRKGIQSSAFIGGDEGQVATASTLPRGIRNVAYKNNKIDVVTSLFTL
jgi:hypothetical protein